MISYHTKIRLVINLSIWHINKYLLNVHYDKFRDELPDKQSKQLAPHSRRKVL